MVYRTVICVSFVGVVLGCGQVTSGGDSDEALRDPAVGLESEASIAPGVGVSDAGLAPSAPAPVATVTEIAPEGEDEAVAVGGASPSKSNSASVQSSSGARVGPSSLEERILKADVIVRARFSSVVASSRSVYRPAFKKTSHVPFVEFTFDVLETLKGAAGDTAVVELEVKPSSLDAGGQFKAPYSDDAAGALAHSQEWIDVDFDTRWNSRQAILFLKTVANSLTNTEGRSESVGYVFVGPYDLDANAIVDDEFSLVSQTNKVWLPSKDEAGSTEFLTEVPTEGSGEDPDTTTLAVLKSTVTSVEAQVENTAGYRECLIAKMQTERDDEVLGDEKLMVRSMEIERGLVAGAVLREGTLLSSEYRYYHLLGDDAFLFSWDTSDTDSDPLTGYTTTLKLNRPVPAGRYVFDVAKQRAAHIPCEYIPTASARWEITVPAPVGTRHEMFFDPVTVGSTVAADGTNGVLKPASFADANGASATIESISYEAGTVEVGVTPDDALAGHVVDFIELDGTVSLSLDVADATVDAETGSGQVGTLSWSVASQPWEDGDLLMVRIREASP